MRAIYRRSFGGSDVLEYGTVDDPTVGPTEVLVRVQAAGLNPGDVHELNGFPYAARLMGYGLLRPKHPVPGTDLAGTVVEVGSDVSDFSVNDEVFGWGTGAFAEFAVADESMLVLKPERLTMEQAAVIPTAAVAAHQALTDVGDVKRGDRVLVVGASGGVGSFAVQIAKAAGAHVTGVAGTHNVELVRSMGADAVIDYTREDFTSRTGAFDVIVDLVGADPLPKASRALAAGGTYVVVGGSGARSLTGMSRFVKAMALSPLLRRRLRPLFSTKKREALEVVRTLGVGNRLMPVIDAVYDLRDASTAFDHVARGHTRGKVAITV